MRPLLLFSLVLLLAPQKQATNEHKAQQQPFTKQQPPEAPKESSETSRTPITNFYTYSTEQENRSEAAKVIFDGLLVLANVGLIWVGLRQARILHKHEEWMQKHDANLVKLADAAKKSADVADSSLKLAERADVLLDACSVVGELLDGKDFRVVLQFKNFGRTRAQEVKLTLHLPIEGVPLTSHEFVPAVTMGPGETKNISSQPFIDFLNEETARAILSQRIPLKFEGGATYKDVFDRPHKSRYTGTYDWGTRCFHIDSQDAD
jgi:hypothetical protein